VDWLKSVGGKVVTGGVALAVLGGAISWWQMSQTDRDVVTSALTRGGAWFVLVLLVPWLLFWLIARVARMDSNAAGAALMLGITIPEAAWLGVMFGFTNHSPAGWTVLVAAVLAAGVYNVLTCDWIAEKVG
jgi:hypothetical protein